ncbi:uncharacterized protein LOC130744332 [Lotus japonicus]|uniref:uncharacterized protein LOC130744332 n=1 Tax=Lotus japonicus TaxID=34305 RepID=UPI0025909888|nr:uncharacterized protein LOC130744332 [Lotus japonicus]
MSIPVEDVGPDVPTTGKEANDVPINNLNVDDGVDVDIDGDHSNQEEINPDPVTVTPASLVVSPPPSFELVDDVYVSSSPTVNPEEPHVEEEVHELVDDEGTESEDYVLARVLSEKKKKKRNSSTPSSISKSSKTLRTYRSTQVQVPAKKKKNKDKKKASVEEVTSQKKSVKRKRRDVDESDVESDVSNIDTTARKRMSGRRIPMNVQEAPLDNISFHFVESASRWKSQVAHGVRDISLSVITAGQVKSWPKKGMLSTGTLNVKYALLNHIGAANWLPTSHSSHISTGFAKLIYLIDTKTPFDFGAFVF